jgi:hypothetical protein
MPADHLRAGTVKARRPRARAGGAKRSALHGAEHRCSIVVVMADGIDVTPDVITSRWSQVDIECDARVPQFPGQQLAGKARAECDLVAGNIFQDKPDRIVRKIWVAIGRVRCGKHAALLAVEHAVSDNLKRQ